MQEAFLPQTLINYRKGAHPKCVWEREIRKKTVPHSWIGFLLQGIYHHSTTFCSGVFAAYDGNMRFYARKREICGGKKWNAQHWKLLKMHDFTGWIQKTAADAWKGGQPRIKCHRTDKHFSIQWVLWLVERVKRDKTEQLCWAMLCNIPKQKTVFCELVTSYSGTYNIY